MELLSINIENHVNYSDLEIPLTGVWNEVSGWLYDRVIAPDSSVDTLTYSEYLDLHTNGLFDGLTKDNWYSFTINNITFLQIRLDEGRWRPIVSPGDFNVISNKHLFSDASCVSKFVDEDNDVHVHTLDSEARYGTIEIATYFRDSELCIYKADDFRYVDEFTGELVDGERLSTEGTPFNSANLAEREREYLIVDDLVYLNGVYEREVLEEEHGDGDLNGRKLFLKYFPIKDSSVEVTEDGVALTEVSTLDFSTSVDDHYYVDYDLGVVYVGGFQAPDLVLFENIDPGDTTITVFPCEDCDQYPSRGLLIIGTETILYEERQGNVFSLCTRAYAGVAGAYVKGETVSDVNHGAGTEGELKVSYTAVPRIEYEISEYGERYARRYGQKLDISPMHYVNPNAVLQIQNREISVASIVLSIDKDNIGSNLFGPMYYGSDTSILTATVYDEMGNPVEDIETTIRIVSGTGLLNSDSDEYTDITNSEGQIYAFFNSAYTTDSSILVDSTTHDGPNTLLQLPEVISSAVDEVYLFQVVKHDRTLGGIGYKAVIEDRVVASAPYGAMSLKLDILVDDSFRDGVLMVTGTDLINYTRTIVYVEKEWGLTAPYTRVYIEDTLPVEVLNQDCYLLESDAIAWDSDTLNGARYIVYSWNGSVYHPVTGDLGAYFPVLPVSVVDDVITYDTLLPIPDPEDNSTNLGAYVVYAPRITTFVAECIDPVTNLTVSSNEIRVKITLAQSFIGVDNTSEALPIPLGWKLISEEFNIASGLGGATFITINPLADTTNRFSLKLEG